MPISLNFFVKPGTLIREEDLDAFAAKFERPSAVFRTDRLRLVLLPDASYQKAHKLTLEERGADAVGDPTWNEVPMDNLPQALTALLVYTLIELGQRPPRQAAK